MPRPGLSFHPFGGLLERCTRPHFAVDSGRHPWKVAGAGASQDDRHEKRNMKKLFWAILLVVLAAVLGAAVASATGDGDEAADETADNVFLGELDLAERMEIWRNQFHRMTPGDAPLVQDVGTWPAAWEEFSHAWAVAPAERDLATWLVPVTAERSGALTVLRDADGNALWSGQTDFSREESTNVTLTGTLVSEEDWTLYEAARAEVARRMASEAPRLRDGEGGGTNNPTPNPSNMFSSVYSVITNGVPELHVGLRWTNNVSMDIFAFGALHQATTNEVTYTNDENQVITTNVVRWHSVESGLTGRYDNLWEHVGTVSLTNLDEVVFADTNDVPERWIVRFYAAFESGDGDNDGLNDAFETTILGTSTNSTDSDNDGIPDGIEYAARSNPAASNIWWVTKTTNEWFRRFPLPDCPLNAPSNHVWDFPVDGIPPVNGSIVSNVTVSGFVDDAIMVDSNGVDFAQNVQTFTDRCITNEISNLQSKHFTLALWDWPNPAYQGANEAKIGASNEAPFRVEWTWLAPLEMRFEPIWTSGTPPQE